MGQVSVHIGGRDYKVACSDGDEPRVTRLAAYIDAKADELTATLGQMSEPRLLFMASLMVTDELFEARESVGVSDTQPEVSAPKIDLDTYSERLEALAAKVAG